MGKTISTHNGSKAHRAHNVRDPKVTEKQTHIDVARSGENETIIDEPPREAYRRIFGEALEDYNEKQKRPERRIKDYYSHIEKDEKKHPVYEMIIQIGDKDDTGANAPIERAILKEFIEGWQERNPNLELIGAYIHADEATLHAHLDYIPVAHGYKNGLSVQNGLVKALGEQGFPTDKDHGKTAQIRWEQRENQELERLCNVRGIEIHHPMAETGAKHVDTPEYKAQKEKLKEIKGEISEAEAARDNIRAETLKTTRERDNLKSECSTLAETKDAIQGKIDAIESELRGDEETYLNLQNMNPKKIGFGGRFVKLPEEEFINLRSMAFEYHRQKDAHEKTKRELRAVSNQRESNFNDYLREREKNSQLERRNDYLEYAHGRLNPETREKLANEYKAQKASCAHQPSQRPKRNDQER